MTRSRSAPLLPQERRAQISRSTKNRLEIERWQNRSAPYPRRLDVFVEDISEVVATGWLPDISEHSSVRKSKDKCVTTRAKQTATIEMEDERDDGAVWSTALSKSTNVADRSLCRESGLFSVFKKTHDKGDKAKWLKGSQVSDHFCEESELSTWLDAWWV